MPVIYIKKGFTMSQNVVMSVKNLTKKFGDFTAVSNLNFDIYKGEILGFLGPNGAGKTTTINMMCGLLKPDSGDILINGKSISNDYKHVRHLIGLCPQDIIIWDKLTCLEQLEFAGQIYGMSTKKARERGLKLLEEMGLIEKRSKLAKTLSGGMQRRLNIALALVHQPEILILDEPQAGLDPQSRVLVRDYIKKISKSITTILTTHDMEEAEKLSDRVAIIDRGSLLVLGTPDSLVSDVENGEVLEIKISETSEEKVKQVIHKFPTRIIKANYLDGTINIISNEVLELLPEISNTLKNSSIKIEDIKIHKKTLEDVFISLTGRGLRE